MKPISSRPAEACDRNVPGHWEGDLLIGQKMTAAIGTLVERTTRYVILVHLPYGYKAPQLRDAVIAACAQIPPALRKTLTWDQGREMAMHHQIETATGTQIFSAIRTHPGNDPPTKTPTGCPVSTSPNTPTCHSIPPMTSKQSPKNSTSDHASSSVIAHPKRS